MTNVHPTAVVHPGAELAEGVEIGPYSIVGPHARIGAGTRLVAHVFVDGWTAIGAQCIIFPFASVGTQTQDLKYKGGQPRVEIGDRTTLREFVTVNAATNDGDLTRVGNDCHIMAYAHVAHDCVVGDFVTFAPGVCCNGNVHIEDHAYIGTGAVLRQGQPGQPLVIGRGAVVGMGAVVTKSVPPGATVVGNPARVMER